jgi:hypothetical protein
VIEEDEQSNGYLVWKSKKNPSMLRGRTVNLYWWQEPGYGNLVRDEALTLAAFAGSGADLERVYSEARVNFDYFMGAMSSAEFSARLCVKVNGRLLERFTAAWRK